MLMAAATATMSAYNFEVDGIYYNINADSTSVSVTYRESATTSNTYSGVVTIPAQVSYNGMFYPVTTIGNNAFRNCSELTGVNLPNTIIRLQSDSFHGCSALTHINFSDSLVYIDEHAFYKCTGLTVIELPDKVTRIADSAFAGCSGLTEIKLSESLQ